MQVIIHNHIEKLEEIMPSWEHLKDGFREITVFQDIDWLKSWWEHKKKDGKKIVPYIVEIKNDDETIGIIPLYIAEKEFANLRFRFLRPIGLIEANYLIPILSKKHPASQLLKKAMEKIHEDKRSWDCIQWGDLPENSIFDLYIKKQSRKDKKLIDRKATGFSPHLILTEEIENMANSMSKKFLRNILTQTRKLNRKGELKFHKVEDESEIEPVMNELFKLHCERWENTSTPSIFEDETEREYHLQLAKRLFKSNLLYLAYLTHNQDTLVVHIGMADGDTHWLYLHAINMKYRNYSVGHVFVYKIILNCLEENYKLIDFLRGGEEYKQKWGTTNEVNVDFLLFNHSLKSTLFRYIHRTYYSKQFLKEPSIKQILVKSVIRGCALFLGIQDVIRPKRSSNAI